MDKTFRRSLLLLAGTAMIATGCLNQDQEKSQGQAEAQDPNPNEGYYRDLYSDTWVATDGVGRQMPSYEEVGDVKNDGQRRVAGIFYITWHGQGLGEGDGTYTRDVTKILEQDPEARLDANNPLWTGGSYHWGEPEMGYFLSQDEWVIRKDMSMLTDAGVDVIILDVTNAVRYWPEWDVTFMTMQQMKAEGNKVPQICFWAFNGDVINVVQDIYDKIYKEEKYKDLWFYWDGKPLMLYNGKPTRDANTNDLKIENPKFDPDAVTNSSNPHYGDPAYTTEFLTDYSQEVKDFFTLRTMWWGYYEWGGERFIGTEDNWTFGYDLDDPRIKSMDPKDLLSLHNGKPEQAAVTGAQHPITFFPDSTYHGVGKSWTRATGQPDLNEYDMPVPTEIPWLGKKVDNPTAYGLYFQERWDEAIAADPQFLYLNDWNEWTAGKYSNRDANGKIIPGPFLNRLNPFFFVDQYNSEFNRCLQPMKGGYTDNYYMQLAQNMRRYKGARPIPELEGYRSILMDGFTGWNKVKVEYRDTKGDVIHRDEIGYGGIHYVNTSGRNDIITSKVAVDKTNVYFYAETTDALTPHTDSNWMLLLVDADNDSSTGWYGYDYMINKSVKSETKSSLMQYRQGQWEEIAELDYHYAGNQLAVSVPRAMMGLEADQFVFDFKWSDNAAELEDPISFALNGDTAPNRRFNYRCIWSK